MTINQIVTLFTFILALTISVGAFGQCNCPPATGCKPCTGGYTSITLRYDGPATALVLIVDNTTTLANLRLSPKEEFTITGSKRNEKFADKLVPVLVNGIANTVLGASCSDLTIGSSYGQFTVIAAVTLGGSSVCCQPQTRDVVAPLITDLPSTITVNSSPGCGATVTWPEPTGSDNCQLKSLETTHKSGAWFHLGTTNVVYTAVDEAGLSFSSSLDIVVQDTQAPVFSGGSSSNIVISADERCSAVVLWNEPQVLDDCSLTVTQSHKPGERFNIGTTPVRYDARDASGNVSSFTFNVIVQDRAKPVFDTFPENIVISLLSECSQRATWMLPTVSDGCSAATLMGTHQPGDEFFPGTTLVTYVARDEAGNENIRQLTITLYDHTAPVFTTFPENISVTLESQCSQRVTWNLPTASDGCSAVTLTASHQPGDEFFPGSSTVKYVATDAHGNETIRDLTITLEDKRALEFVNCPSDITVESEEALPTSITWTPPTASGGCEEITVITSHQPGSFFTIGITPVEYVATTPSGKKTICTFTVTILLLKKKLEISKLITPDGDAKNDEWVVGNIEQFPDNIVVIFDRWGGVIYKASRYDNNRIVWKGTNMSGSIVPTGTYFYSVIATNGKDRIQQSGSLEVVR